MHGKKRHAYKVLVRKSEGKRTLGIRRRRWGRNIKVDLREIEWDWSELDSCDPLQGPMASCYVYGNKISGCM
jgi:hypothetical protein